MGDVVFVGLRKENSLMLGAVNSSMGDAMEIRLVTIGHTAYSSWRAIQLEYRHLEDT